MRVIERRLLVKIQDRTPNALGGITNLIKLTYANLSEDVQELNTAKSKLKAKQLELTAAMTFVKIIIKYLDIPVKTTVEFLECIVTPVADWLHNSWEEITWPSLEFLNNTGPLKKNKNSTIDDRPSITLTEFDLNRFKKQFASLCDRVTRLSSSTSGGTNTIHSASDINRSGDDSHSNDQIINEKDEDEIKNETSDWLNDDILGSGDLLKYNV